MGFFSKPPAERLGPAILDRLPLGISVYRLEDPDDPSSLRLVYSNPASGTITGLDAANETGRRLVDIVPGVTETGLLEAYADVVRTGVSRDLGTIEYGDDQIETASYAVQAFALGESEMAIVFEDVSDRSEVEALRDAQDGIEHERARFEALFNAISDIILVYPVGPDGPEPLIAFNQTAVARYGYSPEELRAMTVHDLLDPTRVDVGGALSELRRTRRATFDSMHLSKNGDRLPMSTSAQLIEYDGRLCVVALCRDDADRREFRRQLARSNNELERAVEERTRQLADFSEDLKILHGITTAQHASSEARLEAYLQAGREMFDLPVGILSATPEDPETGERLYRLDAVLSPDPSLKPGLTVPLSEAFCDAVIRTGKTVAYADALEDAPDHPACVGRGLRAFIGTPILIDDEIVGTLNFVSPEPRIGGFSPSERDLIELMAQAISRRMMAEKSAQERDITQGRYRTIVDTVDAGVLVIDPELTVLASNPAARDALGIRKDIGHLTLADRWPVVDADGNPVVNEDLPELESLRTGRPVRGTLQGVVSPDGTTRWYRVNATPIDQDKDGRPEAVVMSLHEVTDLREAVSKAETARGLLRSVLAASPDGVMAFLAVRDEDQTIVDFEWLVMNPRAGEIVGRVPTELVGQRLLEVFPGNREAGLFDAYVDVVESGQVFRTVIAYPHDGLETSFRITAVPLNSLDGFTVTFAEIVEADLVDPA